MEREKIIEEYIKDGGKVFTIRELGIIRDGGTKCLHTADPNYKFYIHQLNKTLHTSYPPTNDNIITNKRLQIYIIERFESFIKRKEEDIERYKNILINIST